MLHCNLKHTITMSTEPGSPTQADSLISGNMRIRKPEQGRTQMGPIKIGNGWSKYLSLHAGKLNETATASCVMQTGNTKGLVATSRSIHFRQISQRFITTKYTLVSTGLLWNFTGAVLQGHQSNFKSYQLAAVMFVGWYWRWIWWKSAFFYRCNRLPYVLGTKTSANQPAPAFKGTISDQTPLLQFPEW